MIPAAAVDLLGRTNGLVRGGHGDGRPSLARDVHLAEAILTQSGTTNGQVAVQGWRDLERRTGVELADLAADRAGERISFADTQVQPRAVITSPEWSAARPAGGVTPRSSSMSSARSRGTRHVRGDGLGLPAGHPVGPAGLHRHWRLNTSMLIRPRRGPDRTYGGPTWITSSSVRGSLACVTPDGAHRGRPGIAATITRPVAVHIRVRRASAGRIVRP